MRAQQESEGLAQMNLDFVCIYGTRMAYAFLSLIFDTTMRGRVMFWALHCENTLM